MQELSAIRKSLCISEESGCDAVRKKRAQRMAQWPIIITVTTFDFRIRMYERQQQ